MTIRKGEPWGRVGPVPDGVVEARSDAEVRAIVERARREGAGVPPVALLGGDLARTVGAAGALRDEMVSAQVDVVRVESDGETAWFVAHLVARQSWWRGEIAAAMNAQFLGSWDVAPRSHPNDGRLDVVRALASMTLRQRLQARSRLSQGTHVPHPAIETRQVRTIELQLERPTPVTLDGARWRTASQLNLTVEPDALTVVF